MRSHWPPCSTVSIHANSPPTPWCATSPSGATGQGKFSATLATAAWCTTAGGTAPERDEKLRGTVADLLWSLDYDVETEVQSFLGASRT